MYAVRNIRLCTKDCLCLYVCPTGAADTENSIIDRSKCIGCGACAGACPSGAISMVPEELPPQQPKSDAVKAALFALVKSKAGQENAANALAQSAQSPAGRCLAAALEKSNRIMAEDLIREAGYMLPQSGNARAFLRTLLDTPHGEGFPRAAVEELLSTIKPNEPAGRWRCSVCGYLHEGPLPDDFTCPRCGQPAGVFVRLED